jgi:hypothetical protein
MRLQIDHGCVHVVLRFCLGSEYVVKLLEIGHFCLLEFEDGLSRKSLGKTVDVVLSYIEVFHRERDRVICEVG